MVKPRPFAIGIASDNGRVLAAHLGGIDHVIGNQLHPIAIRAEGKLEFVARGPGRGRWRFTPAHAPGPDGLPADAWIAFLRTRERDVSTRDDVRPLSVDEQRRVLAVGACLTCHDGASRAMQDAMRGERPLLGRLSAKCRIPDWEASAPAR